MRFFYIDNIIKKMLAYWVLLWLFVAGFTIYVLPEPSPDKIQNFHFISGFFLLASLVGGFFYKVNNVLSHQASFAKQAAIILLLSGFLAGVCILTGVLFPLDQALSEKIIISKFYFPLFRPQIVLTKFFDIGFQQVFVFGIIKSLKSKSLDDRLTLVLFSTSFFVIHLPLIFSMGLVAFYFIIPSLFAGLAFAYLILNYRFGLVLSFSLHFLFYVLIGLYLRS